MTESSQKLKDKTDQEISDLQKTIKENEQNIVKLQQSLTQAIFSLSFTSHLIQKLILFIQTESERFKRHKNKSKHFFLHFIFFF